MPVHTDQIYLEMSHQPSSGLSAEFVLLVIAAPSQPSFAAASCLEIVDMAARHGFTMSRTCR
jgi:hypothetical protein